jgi:tRNA-specific 2-thiouridylase
VRVLVAMSGGVDSSVAAALALADGHEVVGVTLKLWGGNQDSGCCSIGDVEDARRVAQQLGIAHHIFNFTDDFDSFVVEPYVAAHAGGQTPNPCIECNRHLKFDRLLSRACQLGFDAVATGHHARVVVGSDAKRHLLRGVDAAKDQSYVLHMLGQSQLERVLLPVGVLTKAEVRAKAASLGLRTANKAESQDTCFITATGGRHAFLADRIGLHSGVLVEAFSGAEVGVVPAVELVTVGQRQGLGSGPDGARRYAVAVDVASRTVTVGSEANLRVARTVVRDWTWVVSAPPVGAPVSVQYSAHGRCVRATFDEHGVTFADPERRVAPGQAVVLYDARTVTEVLGGGVAV